MMTTPNLIDWHAIQWPLCPKTPLVVGQTLKNPTYKSSMPCHLERGWNRFELRALFVRQPPKHCGFVSLGTRWLGNPN
jgi:hypothetical protein